MIREAPAALSRQVRGLLGALAQLLALWLLLGAAARAQESVPTSELATRQLEVGASWRLPVGPIDDLIVLDPHIVEAEQVAGDQVLVRARSVGTGVILVLSGGDTRPLSITTVAPPERAPSWRAGEVPEFQYTGAGGLGAAGRGPVFWDTWQQLDVWRGAPDADRSTRAQVAFAAQSGSPDLYLPLAVVELRRPGTVTRIGDTTLELAPDFASMSLRGASLAVRARPELQVEVTGGATAQRICCGLVDTAGEAVLSSRARLALGDTTWLQAGAGFLVPLGAPRLVPIAEAGVGYQGERLAAEVRASRLGEGLAASGGATATLTPSVSTDTRVQLTTRGTWLPSLGPSARGTALLRNTWSLQATRHLRLQPLLVARSLGAEAELPRRDQLTGGGSVGLRGDRPWALDGAYLRGWSFEDGAPAGGSHGLRLGGRTPQDRGVVAGGHVLATLTDTGVVASVLTQGDVMAPIAPRAHAGPRARYAQQGLGQQVDAQTWLGGVGTWGSAVLDTTAEAGWWRARSNEGLAHGPQWLLRSTWRPTQAIQLLVAGGATHIPGTRYDAWRADLGLTVRGPIRGLPTVLGGGRIEGGVFLDDDADGRWDPDEQGLEGVAVEAFGRVRTTDAEGRFAFSNLPEGPKDVVVSRGAFQTVDGVRHTVVVPRLGAASTTFALRRGASIQVRVFDDADRDGRRAPSEAFVGVGAVRLHGPDGVERADAPDGFVAFDGLGSGSYRVEVDALGLPIGWTPTGKLAQDVIIDAAGLKTAHIPLMPQRSVRGRVWIDVNENGTWDGADEPVVRATVLARPSGQSATTDAQGRYLLRDIGDVEIVLGTRGAEPRTVRLPAGPISLERVDLVVPGALPPEEVGPPQDEEPDRPIALRVHPAGSFLHVGERRRFQAVGTYRDLSQRPQLEGVRWFTSEDGAARVSSAGVVEGIATGATEVWAELDGLVAPPAPVEVGQLAIAGLRVAPTELVLDVDDTAGLSASVLFVSGAWTEATDGVRWVSEDPRVAGVDDAGIVRAVAPGTTRVHAELMGVATQGVRVRVGLERGVPARIEARVEQEAISLDGTGRVAVEVVLTDGRTVDGTSLVDFAVSDPEVLHVAPGGRVIPRALGTATVAASWKGIRSRSVPIEVVEPAGLLLVPPLGTIPLDQRVTLTALSVLADGSTQAVRAEFTSSDPRVLAIEDDVLTAVGPGEAWVTATHRRRSSAPVRVRVHPGRVAEVEIAPSGRLELRAGDSAYIDAVAVFSDGSRSNVTALAGFRSSDWSVLDVEDGGVIVAREVGRTSLRAAFAGAHSTALEVEVRAADDDAEDLRLVVEPGGEIALRGGRDEQLEALIVRSDGTRVRPRDVAWATGDPRVAIVDATGRVRARGPGTTVVWASWGPLRSSPVAVIVPELVGMTVRPPLRTVPVGARIELTALGVLDDGTIAELDAATRWTSSDERVARIEEGGVVLAVRPGVAELRASAEGLVSTPLEIEVVDDPLVELSVGPERVTATLGAPVALEATARYASGRTDQATHYAVWSSSRPDVVEVFDGVGVAERAGVTDVRASWLGLHSEPTVVRVAPPEMVDLTLEAPAALLVGAEVTGRALAVLTSGEIRDLSAQAGWTSSDGSVLQASPEGLLRARAAGVVTLQTRLGADTSPPITVRVVDGQVTALELVAPAQPVRAGSPLWIEIRARLDDGQTIDVSTQVDWRIEGSGVRRTRDGSFAVAAGARAELVATWGSAASEPVLVHTSLPAPEP